MMLRTIDHGYVNTALARSVSMRRRGEKNKVQVRFEYGDNERPVVVEVLDTDFQRFETWATYEQLVPSPEGYTLLQYWSDAEGEEVTRWPVIAWQFDPDGDNFHGVYTPWTSPGRADDAVLLPDGRVVETGSQTWPDEAAWLKERQERARREREYETAKQAAEGSKP